MLRPPLVDGAKPVTALIEAFGVHSIASVEAAPVAVTVTTVAQVAEEIELVPSAAVPLAMVWVTGSPETGEAGCGKFIADKNFRPPFSVT
jgi:hypothetical protein